MSGRRLYNPYQYYLVTEVISTMVKRFLYVFVLSASLLSGCAMFGKSEENVDKRSAEQFYEEGQKAMKIGDYKQAIEHFENLVSRHPFGVYAQQAQLEIAYAYYKFDEPESSVAAADQFIKLYPRNEHVDYAYYIKGLARFPKEDFFERKFDLDPAQRDPRALRESFQFFSELMQRFPASRYVEDATQRMIYLRNNLARGEMYAADYYMKKAAYVAAVNRAKYIIEHYDRTPSVPDALELMATAYDKLDLPKLADDARRILALNFPDRAAAAGALPVGKFH